MNEKYYVVDNAGQYFIILKCTEQKMSDYVNYGHMRCISDEGAIDLLKASEWLIAHNTKHTVVSNRIDNPLLRMMLQKDMSHMVKSAVLSGLLIPDQEIEDVLMMSDDDKSEVFWLN